MRTSRLAINDLNDFVMPWGGLTLPPADPPARLAHQAALQETRYWLRRTLNFTGQQGELRPLFPSYYGPEARVPFIKYYVTTTPRPIHWAFKTDEVSYVVHDDNLERLAYIQNLLEELLHRNDGTAWDVNRFLHRRYRKAYVTRYGDQDAWPPIAADPTAPDPAPLEPQYEFNTFRFGTRLEPDPAEEEGGIHTGLISFTYDYSLVKGIGI